MRFGVCSSCNQYNYLNTDGTCPACSDEDVTCSGNVIAHRCDDCGDTLAIDCDDHETPDTTPLCLNTGEPKADCACDDGAVETIEEATSALETLRDDL